MQAEHLENAWYRGSTYHMLAIVITIVSFSFHPSVCCSIISISYGYGQLMCLLIVIEHPVFP